MPYIAIINRSTHTIETLYEGAVSNQSVYGGPWGWPRATVHLPIPETLNKELVKVSLDETGAYVFEIDAEKEQVANAGKWDALRAERNLRLTNSDWTQLSDIPFTINKEAWAAYRQALRDITHTTMDIHNIVWPDTPIPIVPEAVIVEEAEAVAEVTEAEAVAVVAEPPAVITDSVAIVEEVVVAEVTEAEAVVSEPPAMVEEAVSVITDPLPAMVAEPLAEEVAVAEA